MTVLNGLPHVNRQVVVCLEDDRDLSRLIQVTIRPWTRAFHAAYDGIHGLELIRRERPALVLLDINLPGMNGLDVYASLQDDPDLRQLPVIILSAGRTRRSLDGVAGYITKPFSLSQLRDMVCPFLAP